ncbi:hypothetical protein EK904_011773 [Melospiza melodia maxima]|nr:hypothetical protein EK904_011773 [Melospiza melodia maxima]
MCKRKRAPHSALNERSTETCAACTRLFNESLKTLNPQIPPPDNSGTTSGTRGYYPCNCRIFSLMTQHTAGVPDTLCVLPTPGILPHRARHSCLGREKAVPPCMVMASSPHHQLPQLTAASCLALWECVWADVCKLTVKFQQLEGCNGSDLSVQAELGNDGKKNLPKAMKYLSGLSHRTPVALNTVLPAPVVQSWITQWECAEPPKRRQVLEERRAHHPEIPRLSRAPVINQGTITHTRCQFCLKSSYLTVFKNQARSESYLSCIPDSIHDMLRAVVVRRAPVEVQLPQPTFITAVNTIRKFMWKKPDQC